MDGNEDALDVLSEEGSTVMITDASVAELPCSGRTEGTVVAW
ncbi:hypothetical protein [Kocuria palustris]|nr:hypothetical protein [Kocuria palustris]